MRTEQHPEFTVDEQAVARGYHATPKRFLFTMNAANHELIDGIAKELDIDAITFCRAAVQKVAAEYMIDKEPFIKACDRARQKVIDRLAAFSAKRREA